MTDEQRLELERLKRGQARLEEDLRALSKRIESFEGRLQQPTMGVRPEEVSPEVIRTDNPADEHPSKAAVPTPLPSRPSSVPPPIPISDHQPFTIDQKPVL